MRKVPRNAQLNRVLRQRRASFFKDRRAPKGGARNTQRDILDALGEDIIECDNWGKEFTASSAIIVNTEIGQMYVCSESCANSNGEGEDAS